MRDHDTVSVEVPFVFTVPIQASPPRRVRLSEPCVVPVARSFDARHDVTLPNGTVVPVGTLGGRVMVRAPWDLRLPPERAVPVPDATGGVKEMAYVESDPTCVRTGAGTVVRPRDKVATPTADDHETLSTGGRMYRKSPRDVTLPKRAALRAWMDGAAVVDGDVYVPSLGVGVRVAHAKDGALRPVVEFGWGETVEPYGVDGLVAWTDGWTPPGPFAERWDAGELDVPEAVRIGPAAVAVRRAVATLKDATAAWGSHSPTGSADRDAVRRAVLTGDVPYAVGVLVREFGEEARERFDRGASHWGAVTARWSALGDAMAALDPEARLRAEAVADASVDDGAAPEGLESVSFGM